MSNSTLKAPQFNALFNHAELQPLDNGAFQLILEDHEYLRAQKGNSNVDRYSPKQVAARWDSFLNRKGSDFAATFKVGDDVDVLTLRLTNEPVYSQRGDKLIFSFRPFSQVNKAVLKDLSNKDLSSFNLFSSVQQVNVPKPLKKEYRQALATPISDGGQWRMKPEDAYFTGLTPEDITDWRQRNSPFLLSNGEWDTFTHDLYSALNSDGFAAPLDIRLNGSAARLFSNPTKTVPSTARDAVILYESETKTEISQEKAKDILINYDRWLGAERQRESNDIPRYRTVDLMANLGLGDRSDIDLQITSDVIAQKIVELADQKGVSAEKIKHPVYGFYSRELVAEALPNTSAVMQKWSSNAEIGIGFTFALFDGIGPLNSIAHFRNSDWMVGMPNTSDFDSPVWYSSDWNG
jgi:hypothetical protein